jgi:hypothetical protein
MCDRRGPLYCLTRHSPIVSLRKTCHPLKWEVQIWRTDKKENQIFLIYTGIQSGAVAKSYMRTGFLIYEEMRKYFPIYDEAVCHIDFATAPFLYMRKIWFSLLTVRNLYFSLWYSLLNIFLYTDKYIYWWIFAENCVCLFCFFVILPGFILIISQYCFSLFPECSEQHLGASSLAISPAGHWQGHLPAAGQLGPRLLPRPPPPRPPRPPPPARPGCGAAASAPPPGGTVRGVWQQGTGCASTLPSSTGQPDWTERYKQFLEFSFTQQKGLLIFSIC